jgi:hypothetical protein
VLAVPAAALTCSLAAAKAVVRTTHLTIPASQSVSGGGYRISPGDVDGTICIPLPGGKKAMVLTVGSGGTAGDIDWAVYVSSGGPWKLALVRGGYKLGLARKGADIVETDPIYEKNDPNCCPSGGFAHTRWHWNGSKLTVIRTWHDSKYQE